MTPPAWPALRPDPDDEPQSPPWWVALAIVAAGALLGLGFLAGIIAA